MTNISPFTPSWRLTRYELVADDWTLTIINEPRRQRFCVISVWTSQSIGIQCKQHVSTIWLCNRHKRLKLITGRSRLRRKREEGERWSTSILSICHRTILNHTCSRAPSGWNGGRRWFCIRRTRAQSRWDEYARLYHLVTQQRSQLCQRMSKERKRGEIVVRPSTTATADKAPLTGWHI